MIISSNLHELRNGEFMAFISNTLDILNKADLTATGLQEQVMELSSVYSILKEHYKMERSSRITRSLVLLDEARDRYFVSLRGLLQFHTQGHPDETLRQQANLLLKALENHGSDLHRKNYQEQTAGTYSIINIIEQSEELTATIKALYLEEYFEGMKTSNAEFDESYLERNSEYAAIPKEKLAELREQGEKLFEKIVLYINANLVLAEDTTPFETLASEIDTLVKTYQENARRRHGNSIDEDLNEDYDELEDENENE
ncbi:DUF6261 family protein [Abyssalbus ytuae]|uniref:DUF6261 family protein n=1 Tax=Abyssalbus ytuae TaxID=2926907 RepID=A0A9E7CYW8_9FLAO|nr:DUF6261 family protein [Abyssalbus ytuae]UOB17065.1 DUF6261 family protein [Abyssalbus ytuae]